MGSTLASWDFPRNTFGVLVVVEVAEELGVSAEESLNSTGLSRADLMNLDLEVAAGLELIVIRNVLARLGDQPGLGARAGARFSLGMLGSWGFAMLNSPTPREAIELGLRYGYGEFSFVFARPWVDERYDEIRIVFDDAELPDDLRLFLIERDLAANFTVTPLLFGSSIPIRHETTLAGERGDRLAEYTGVPVVTAAAHDAIVLPRWALDVALPQADQHAVRRWIAQCDALSNRHQRETARAGSAAMVRSAILREPDRAISLEAVAATWHISERTLRRRLAEEGTTFRELTDIVRATIADKLLCAGATVSNVAHQLGYADAASFIRAYKRWRGHTPGAAHDLTGAKLRVGDRSSARD